MTAAERAARLAELDADIARVRVARRRILEGGQAWAGEGRSRQNAELSALRAEEEAMVAERATLVRPRQARTYKFNYR